jgi:hypothetical protein
LLFGGPGDFAHFGIRAEEIGFDFIKYGHSKKLERLELPERLEMLGG